MKIGVSLPVRELADDLVAIKAFASMPASISKSWSRLLGNWMGFSPLADALPQGSGRRAETTPRRRRSRRPRTGQGGP